MNIKPALLAITLITPAAATLAEDNKQCPQELVTFWQTVSTRMENADAVPRFLLNNQCIKVQGSTEFPALTAQRLDDPERQELIDQMYAQLNWPASSKNAIRH